MAGFPSQYSPELWQQARDLVAQGMPMSEVSERTGISVGNIKMRAQRYEWFVPVTALAKAKEVLQQAAKSNETEVLPSVSTGLQIADSIAEIGQKGQISVLRGMLPRLLKTFESDSPLLKKDVEDWKTAGSMVNIFSKLSGIDKPQTGIQVNVWGDGWGAQGAVPVESSEVETEE